MVIMVTTNYTFSKMFRLLPFSVASIILSHMYIMLRYLYSCLKREEEIAWNFYLNKIE